jgi:hypothetical protein
MTAASHVSEVHRMVDRLTPAQLEALYVLLRAMVGRLSGAAERAAVAGGEAVPAAGYRFPSLRSWTVSPIWLNGPPESSARSRGTLRMIVVDTGVLVAYQPPRPRSGSRIAACAQATSGR